MRAAFLAVQQHADENLAQVIPLVGPTALAAKDDAYLSAHEAGSFLPLKFLPNFGLGPEKTEHHGPNRYRLAGEWGKSMA